MKKEMIRRSITIPSSLDSKISLMVEEYDYKVKNNLIVELLELGLLKFNEDRENKQLNYNLIDKINCLIDKLENN